MEYSNNESIFSLNINFSLHDALNFQATSWENSKKPEHHTTGYNVRENQKPPFYDFSTNFVK